MLSVSKHLGGSRSKCFKALKVVTNGDCSKEFRASGSKCFDILELLQAANVSTTSCTLSFYLWKNALFSH